MLVWNEKSYEKGIDRESRTACHQRRNQNGEQTLPFSGDSTCRHHCRDRTSEASNEGYNGATIQSNAL